MLIDLRSDTVTRPSPAMLDFMFKAKVGDDVFGEDPTVNLLETKVAAMFGMEAALFVPSGTMSNQIAVNVHCRPGDEVICDINSHIYQYEGGGLAANSGVQVKLLEGNRGRISAEMVKNAVNGNFDWLTKSTLVVVENTCNKAGGSVYSLENLKELSTFCKQANLKFHLDGARIFNALAAQNLKAENLKGIFDSISVCLSKGLGSPVGSVLLGSKEFITQARRVRKRWGGGMRQAGYLAAAGIFSLDNNMERLKEDHLNAQKIKASLERKSFVKEVLPVETNIVIFRLTEELSVSAFLKHLESKEMKAIQFGYDTVRMITHLDISAESVEKVCNELQLM